MPRNHIIADNMVKGGMLGENPWPAPGADSVVKQQPVFIHCYELPLVP